MIIRGILDRSLSSQLCIRGFAPIKELARISKPDFSYQRNPIYEQEKVIQTFLDEEEYLFFPEVILSFKIKHNAFASKDNSLTPIQWIETKGSFKSNVDGSLLKVKKIAYKDKQDIRKEEDLKIVDLTLNDEELNKLINDHEHPFNRVDGNHRLRAAEVAKSDKVNNMVVPFCIILTETIYDKTLQPDGTYKPTELNKGDKFERAVFHNINTKTIPLTSEENLKVILDDVVNFQDSELENKFGWEYLATRRVYKDFPSNTNDVYPNLGTDFTDNLRTFSKEIIRLLKEEKVISKSSFSPKKVKNALIEINQTFGNNNLLKEKCDRSIVIAAIFLNIAKYDIDLYLQWILKNHIIDIPYLSPRSLIDIYRKLQETKTKQIFVSMQFDSGTKPHYDAIKKAVSEINENYSMEIKIREIRIDEFNEGNSYKIDDKILELIENSGLLIADLSSKNINVYHELGFLMGLNRGNGLKQENFILLKKQTSTSSESEIGFNIRPFQQLRFTDTLELVSKLKEALECYFNLK